MRRRVPLGAKHTRFHVQSSMFQVSEDRPWTSKNLSMAVGGRERVYGGMRRKDFRFEISELRVGNTPQGTVEGSV